MWNWPTMKEALELSGRANTRCPELPHHHSSSITDLIFQQASRILPKTYSYRVFESEAKLYGLNQEFDHDGSPHLCFVSDILFRPCSFYFKWPSEKEKNWVRMENFKSYHFKVCSGNLYGGKKNLMLWKRGYSERKNLIESKRSRPMRYFLAANEIIYLIQWYLLFEWPRSLWNLVTLNQLKFNLNQVNVFAWWNLWTAQVKITQ